MDKLSQIPGLGPKTQSKLERLGIVSPQDLLFHFPHRYIDFSKKIPISHVKEYSNVTITGIVSYFQNIYTRSHKQIQKARIEDKTGSIEIIWFNQPYLLNIIRVGDRLSFAGTVSTYQNKYTLMSPEYGPYNTGKIIAVYPETQGLSSKWFRKTIQQNFISLVKDIQDNLPEPVLKEFQLMGMFQALKQIHIPESDILLTQARTRLGINEILSLQSQSYLQKSSWLSKQPRQVLSTNKKIDEIINEFIKNLPFKLTPSQKKVWTEIKTDLLSAKIPTNRLIQGDVGSGKTIIAILAAYLTSLNNSTTLLLAPTEVLARQHYTTIKNFLQAHSIPVKLLTGNSKLSFKTISPGSIIVSTHAAIYHKKTLEDKIALLIVDEQHKFGVKQRSFLSSLNRPPHCLTMSATPIPRTISLTMLGNLNLSTVDNPPKKRLPIKTFLVPKQKALDCYQWIKKQIKETKQQAFIVCPFINESESMESIKSAVKEYEYLSNEIFPDLKIALIHGKINNESREKVFQQFRKNKINILVTTPIIEVGIDIPNATIILIQSADRFGLAQLHQLRGRVGRGPDQSYCYFFTESDNQKSLNRLKYLEKNHQGIKIAEYDLKTRGPGEAFSTLQHGYPSLKIANLSDLNLITKSKQILEYIIKFQPNYNLNQLILTPNQSTNSLIYN